MRWERLEYPVMREKMEHRVRDGPLVENSDTYAIAGLVVGIAGAFLNGVGVCVLFLRRGTQDARAVLRTSVCEGV